MKFGLFYEVQTPKPVDSDDWAPGQEAQQFREALDQIELADQWREQQLERIGAELHVHSTV
jgi:hypothetical protein